MTLWIMLKQGSLKDSTPNLINIFQRVQGDMESTWNSRLKLVTFNCDLDLVLACLSYGFSLRQIFDQSFMKIFQRVQEIWSEQERDGWPSIVTLTLSLHHWVIGSTNHLTKANIWPKFNKAVWMAMERPQNSRLKLVTFNCDLESA